MHCKTHIFLCQFRRYLTHFIICVELAAFTCSLPFTLIYYPFCPVADRNASHCAERDSLTFAGLNLDISQANLNSLFTCPTVGCREEKVHPHWGSYTGVCFFWLTPTRTDTISSQDLHFIYLLHVCLEYLILIGQLRHYIVKYFV